LATIVWHLTPIHKFDVTGKFCVNGSTRVVIRTLGRSFAQMHQWTHGNLIRSTEVIKWHWRPLHQQCQSKDSFSVCIFTIMKT